MKLYRTVNDIETAILDGLGDHLEQIQFNNSQADSHPRGTRGHEPVADEIILPNEYFDRARCGENMTNYHANTLWQYYTDSMIGIINNEQFEFYNHISYVNDLKSYDQFESIWCTRPQSQFYGIGMLYDPVGYFLRHLKYDRGDLRINITGHYRGTFMVGREYLLDLLKNCTEWWMESQTQRFKRWQPDALWHEDLQHQVTQQEITEMLPEIEWPYGIKCILNSIRKVGVITDHNLERHHLWGKLRRRDKFNVWLERHVNLEESSWYFLQDPEVWEAFTQRYSEDFALGGFSTEPRTGDWIDYWKKRVGSDYGQ